MSLLDNLQDNSWVTAALQRGARQALIKHKALGVSIAIWRDGAVVLIPPDEIEIPADPDEHSSTRRRG
jgi:hypothetical protein